MNINNLSKIFEEYEIYPEETFSGNSPLRVFQRLYPENYYSIEVQELVHNQRYEQTKRGADLPWWGSEFFKDNKKSKFMIVSQDSLSKDAGSIVFWSQLYPVINSKEEYEIYNSLVDEKDLFKYTSWSKVKKQLSEWNIDLNNCYITDAAKVYKEASYKDRDFDNDKSKELLISEIEACKPNIIIILGGQPLRLLFPEFKYSEVVESGEYLDFNGIKVIVSPFITGQGPTQKNHKERLNIASGLIREDGEIPNKLQMNHLSFSKELIALCGVNCGVCMAHLRKENKCCGCLSDHSLKSSRGIKCGIRFCSEHNKSAFTYCFECRKFPCTRLKSLEKRYVSKYNLSVIDNLNYIKQYGLNEFIIKENEKWRCRNCGEVLCVHRSFCLNCKEEYR